MAKLHAVEECARIRCGTGEHNLGERILMLVPIRCERAERLELRDRLDPDSHPAAVPPAPPFHRKREVRTDEEQQPGDDQREREKLLLAGIRAEEEQTQRNDRRVLL